MILLIEWKIPTKMVYFVAKLLADSNNSIHFFSFEQSFELYTKENKEDCYFEMSPSSHRFVPICYTIKLY